MLDFYKIVTGVQLSNIPLHQSVLCLMNIYQTRQESHHFCEKYVIEIHYQDDQ